jgi:Tol biopolymer transport system component
MTVLWLVSGTGTATAQPTLFPAESARIAFGSHRDGNWEVYLTDADGQNQTRLTTRNGHTRFPLWSTDRTRIAFATQVGGAGDGWDFWVMNADGSGARRLCSGLVGKSGREWSPDGKRIVLTRLDSRNMDVYIVEVASGRLSRITTTAGEDRDPAWSPDGAQIVFSSERDGNREIYVVRSDGSDVRRLTNHPAKDVSPAWSPDGSRIVFVSARSGTPELYLMTVDGLHVERLTSGAYASSDVPRWSPDGSRLAFQIAEGGRYDIGLLRLRDRQQKVLVGTSHNDGSYSWSPDGTRLAYISGPVGAENLHIVDVESQRSTRITATWSLTPGWAR